MKGNQKSSDARRKESWRLHSQVIRTVIEMRANAERWKDIAIKLNNAGHRRKNEKRFTNKHVFNIPGQYWNLMRREVQRINSLNGRPDSPCGPIVVQAGQPGSAIWGYFNDDGKLSVLPTDVDSIDIVSASLIDLLPWGEIRYVRKIGPPSDA